MDPRASRTREAVLSSRARRSGEEVDVASMDTGMMAQFRAVMLEVLQLQQQLALPAELRADEGPGADDGLREGIAASLMTRKGVRYSSIICTVFARMSSVCFDRCVLYGGVCGVVLSILMLSVYSYSHICIRSIILPQLKFKMCGG